MNDSSLSHQEPPSDFGIRLLDGENILLSLRPYRFKTFQVVAAACTIIGLILTPLVFVYALIAERRYHYWLTNKRVIWCHGFIGYKIRSVPLERIADVVISRTLPEILAGITSIEIRDMTGQTQVRQPGFGSDFSARWIGVQNAPEVQKLILEQIKQANERSGRI